MAQERQNEASNSSPESAQSRRDRRAVRTGRSKIVLVFLVAIVLLTMGGRWVYHRYTHVYTEDARIDGDVVTISSRVSGWLTELNVIEGDSVTKGQVLAKVDARDSILQREVLLSKLKSIESQMAVIRAQSGQVDEETLGKLQSDTSQLVAAEGRLRTCTRVDGTEMALPAGYGAYTHELPAGARESSQGGGGGRSGPRNAVGLGREPQTAERP